MELDKKLDLSVQKTRKFLRFLSGFIALSGLVNFVLLLLLPADEKSALVLGYSSKRLALLTLLFIGSVSFIIAGIKLSKTCPKTILAISNTFKKQGVSAFLILFFFLALLLVWVAGFSPEYLLRDYYAIGKRLLPFLIWLMSISVAALGFCIFLHNSALKTTIFTDRKYFRLLAVTTAVLILLFLFIAWIYPKLTDQLWFGRYSVPILVTQIFAAWVLVSLGLLVPGNFWKKWPAFFTDHTDLIIFLLIWVFTAFLWVNQPIEFMGDMYSTTIEQHIKPLPPNFEIYPRKDSLTYFNITESIVTGGGIYRSIDKSLFLAFEGLNNWLTGGSYEKMLNLQTILLASFPAVIYLLGSKIHSRPAGLLAAALAVMQEINGIRLMDEFPVVSSKVLLSEPFMQLWTAIIALSGFLAFKRSGNRQANLFIILGGSLGLSALFRLNTVVVIPFIIFVAFIYYFRDRKTMIWSIGVFLIGIFLAFSPWMIHNAIKYGDPLAFVKSKVSGVIINNRYEKINKDVDTNNGLEEEGVSEIFNESDGILPVNYAWNNNHLERSTNLEMAFAGLLTVRHPIADLTITSNIPQIFVSIFRHSLNNIITSFSILPASINPQDLFHGSRNQRFWGGYDATSYEGINPVFLVINLLILSVGISSAINNHQVIGLVPIAVYLGYHLSNGIAISSGNRYAQPASWIIFFYYAIGLISISKSLLNLLQYDNQFNKLEPDKSNQKNNRIGLIIVIICVLVIGNAPVIADLLPINRFPKINEQQIISTLFNEENLQNKEYGNNIRELFSFYKEDSVSVTFGRVLTPILVNNEEFKLAYGNNNYGGTIRYLTFMNLGPGLGNIKRMIFYPQNQFLNLKNGSDAVIIYRVENENEAIAIGIIDPIFSSQISTYKDISHIPLSNFYFSENISEIE
ncbi:MAG: hypothetical protein Q8N39_11130 [Pelolinea sp.]|nr:hypothetical protein [Pelolinea sp.]